MPHLQHGVGQGHNPHLQHGVGEGHMPHLQHSVAVGVGQGHVEAREAGAVVEVKIKVVDTELAVLDLDAAIPARYLGPNTV